MLIIPTKGSRVVEGWWGVRLHRQVVGTEDASACSCAQGTGQERENEERRGQKTRKTRQRHQRRTPKMKKTRKAETIDHYKNATETPRFNRKESRPRQHPCTDKNPPIHYKTPRQGLFKGGPELNSTLQKTIMCESDFRAALPLKEKT